MYVLDTGWLAVYYIFLRLSWWLTLLTHKGALDIGRKLAKMGGAGHNVRSSCIDGHHLGTEHAAIVQSREVDVEQGFC